MLSILRNMLIRDTVMAPVPVVLGRWGIQYDPKIIECKVFQANEDHCGCCVAPKKEVAVAKNSGDDEKLEEYLLPYVLE